MPGNQKQKGTSAFHAPSKKSIKCKDSRSLPCQPKKHLRFRKETRKLEPAGADATFPACSLDYVAVVAEATAWRSALSGSALKRVTVSKIIVSLPFAVTGSHSGMPL